MNNVFVNSKGRAVFADDVVPAVENGYFALLIKDDKILLHYPPKNDVPELVGGVCPRGENLRDNMSRLIYEQTGVDIMPSEAAKHFEQEVDYADDNASGTNPFIHYHQAFDVFDVATYWSEDERLKWVTPDGGCAVWAELDDVLVGKLKINYWHFAAMQKIFDED